MKDLRRLAASYGALLDYYGIEGLERVRPDALLAVLELLGAPVRNHGDVESAWRARREQRRNELLPPVVVAWDDRPLSIPLRSRWPAGRGELTLLFEDGSTSERFVELSHRRLAISEPPPSGYHRLFLRSSGLEAESLLVSAPRRSFRFPGNRRRWGLFAPLYSAWSRESWDAGDLSDLRRLVERTASHGGSFVATLPLFSTFVEDPSPYSPVSRMFWNELYVDPRKASEWGGRWLPVDEFDQGKLIDYRALESRKRPLLESMAREARDRRSPALLEFARQRPELASYARFRAEKEDGRRRDDATLAPDLSDDRVLYHVYGQMAAERQLRSLREQAAATGVGLYLDLPLGVHRSGFDVSTRAPLFAHDADVGAPPDAVFPDGQNWGFPPLLPERCRAEGHLYLRQSLASAMRHADVLRVDHVMGLHRQFWIPRGFEERDGVYVRYPAEELYAIFNLESHRNRCELVGENLGIVPPAVNERLENHRWRGIYVLQFSLRGATDGPLAPIPEGVVASFNTHDTPTFAGFCRGRDLAERVEAGLLDEERAERLRITRAEEIGALDSCLGVTPEALEDRLERWLCHILASAADLVSITLEDLWLEESPQNVPGRVDLPNWRRKLRYAVDALPEDVVSILDEIARRS